MKDSVKDEPIEQTEMNIKKEDFNRAKMITKMKAEFDVTGDTLRDLFAAHALNAIVSHQINKGIPNEDFAAVTAYDYADAMLIRRGR